MDVTAARGEVESWLRALAAPLAPWAAPRPAPSVPMAGPDAAGVPPTRPATPSAGEPAAPAAAGAAGPAVRIAPRDITGGGITPGRGTDMSARSGPDRLAAAAPGMGGLVAKTAHLGAAVDAADPGPAVASADVRRAARAAVTGPDESGDAGLAALVPSQPEPADDTAPGLSNWPALVSAGEDRPAGRDGASRNSTSAWPARPYVGAGLSTEIEGALAPLLPGAFTRSGPPVAPPAVDIPKWTDVPLAAATDALAGAYPYGVGSVPPDPAAVADLADLLAGVLEDETRALGVLELEP